MFERSATQGYSGLDTAKAGWDIQQEFLTRCCRLTFESAQTVLYLFQQIWQVLGQCECLNNATLWGSNWRRLSFRLLNPLGIAAVAIMDAAFHGISWLLTPHYVGHDLLHSEQVILVMTHH